jgi:hypothetical protein
MITFDALRKRHGPYATFAVAGENTYVIRPCVTDNKGGTVGETIAPGDAERFGVHLETECGPPRWLHDAKTGREAIDQIENIRRAASGKQERTP